LIVGDRCDRSPSSVAQLVFPHVSRFCLIDAPISELRLETEFRNTTMRV
jgi:hypothetical protein